MAEAIGGFKIDPKGQTVDVTATFAGATATLYTTSAATVSHTLPKEISDVTAFYVAAAGTYTLSVQLNGTEIADSDGTTRPVIVDVGTVTTYAAAVDSDTQGEFNAKLRITETYSGADSYQTSWTDLTVADGAGSTDGADPSQIYAYMGNIFGDGLTAANDANSLGAVAGKFSVTGTLPSTYPQAAVHGIINGDDFNVNSTKPAAFVAVLDGDAGTTIAGAAYKVMSNNSTAASGFHYGLDLQDAAHDGFQPVDSAFYLSAPIRLCEDVVFLVGTATPTDGTSGTGAGVAGPGSLHMNTSDAKLRTNTNTKASPTWTIVGAQTA